MNSTSNLPNSGDPYTLYNYYVEVWLHQPSGELKKAVAFDDYERLDPFLPSVDVSRLYALL